MRARRRADFGEVESSPDGLCTSLMRHVIIWRWTCQVYRRPSLATQPDWCLRQSGRQQCHDSTGMLAQYCMTARPQTSSMPAITFAFRPGAAMTFHRAFSISAPTSHADFYDRRFYISNFDAGHYWVEHTTMMPPTSRLNRRRCQGRRFPPPWARDAHAAFISGPRQFYWSIRAIFSGDGEQAGRRSLRATAPRACLATVSDTTDSSFHHRSGARNELHRRA